ncbi:hypothetical protein B1810_08625 [Panacagrimonas perspica]|nr:hypothetical protein B1810_08625 [Panacagrimonas perspica]
MLRLVSSTPRKWLRTRRRCAGTEENIVKKGSIGLLVRWLMSAAALVAMQPAHAQLGLPTQNLQVGCGWMLAFDPTRTGLGNTAFPEINARYWIAVVSDTAPAGSRLRIQGQYPDARYSAFHVHDGNLFVFEAISDNELVPDPGSANRNLDRTRRDDQVPVGGSYTAYVRINAAVPAVRETNTLYRPKPGALDAKVKKRTALAYRTYLPVGGNEGGAPLPTLTLETPSGPKSLPNAADAAVCASIQKQFHTDGSALPVSLTPPVIPPAMPVFVKFDDTVLAAAGLGVGYNPHNGFLALKSDRDYADFLLVRGKLPSYTTQDQPQPTPLVRYWSLCQYGAASTRVYACIADQQLKLDAEGYYNIVISRDWMRPVLLPAQYDWLPWGTEKQGAVTIRELLAHPSFAKSIEKSSASQTAADRGEYMPLATYCSQAVLAAAAGTPGAGTGDAFAACRASRQGLLSSLLPLPVLGTLPPIPPLL